MSFEGRMARGKYNFETNRFMDSSETLDYIASMEVPKEKPKKEKKKNDK